MTHRVQKTRLGRTTSTVMTDRCMLLGAHTNSPAGNKHEHAPERGALVSISAARTSAAVSLTSIRCRMSVCLCSHSVSMQARGSWKESGI